MTISKYLFSKFDGNFILILLIFYAIMLNYSILDVKIQPFVDFTTRKQDKQKYIKMTSD